MRISDWSSDVCSSDLSASPNLSLLSSSKPSPGIYQTEPAEKLGKLLKPLHKDLQLAITDILPLRLMIKAAEEDYAQPITRLAPRLLAFRRCCNASRAARGPSIRKGKQNGRTGERG